MKKELEVEKEGKEKEGYFVRVREWRQVVFWERSFRIGVRHWGFFFLMCRVRVFRGISFSGVLCFEILLKLRIPALSISILKFRSFLSKLNKIE